MTKVRNPGDRLVNHRYYPEMRTLAIGIVLAGVLACLILSCGCISRLADTGPVQSGGGSVGATLLSQQSHWSPAEGCYWTVTYQVYNSGNTTSAGQMVRVELVNTRNLAVRDSKTVFVGPLKEGESMPVTALLDGECIGDYAAKVSLTPAS
jgi:hypothetical protein